jgi:hypothetical protein
MTSLFQKFEQYMMAATFAEAGEHQTAMEMLTDQDRVQKRDRARVSRETVRPRPELRAPSVDE